MGPLPVLAALQPFGFPLATWSRMPHAMPGVESFAGRERLPAFLARTRMLIALLPSTDETRGFRNWRRRYEASV